MKASTGLVAAAEERRKREAQDELVLDIAKGENESVTLSVRAAIERGYQATFIDSLREALKKKENEIDRICGRNYSEFLTSTADMLRMRGAASDLTDIVRKIHGDFNNSGEDMVAILTRLEELQTERSQTRGVLEIVISCKELSKLMLQAKNFLDVGEHYSAMQIVEKVQKGYLPVPGTVITHGEKEVVQYKLPKPVRSMLDRWMPSTILQLTSQTTDTADALLYKLRDKSQLIGRVVLKRQSRVALLANTFSLGDDNAATTTGRAENDNSMLSELYADRYSQLTLLHKAPSFSLQHVKRCAASLRLNRWLEPGDVNGWISDRYQWGKVTGKNRTSKKEKFAASGAGATASTFSSSSLPEKDKKEFDYLHKVTDQEERFLEELSESLGPLHKAIHIAAVLHRQANLHEHFRSQRGPALTDILDANEEVMRTCALTDPGGLVQYISSMAGFFMLECVIRKSVERQEGAFAWQEIIELWTNACIRLDILVARQSDSLRTPEQILMVKDEISLLAEACNDESLGLPPSQLYETIRLMWSRFEEVQIGAIHEAVVVASVSHKAYEGFYVTDMKTLATKVLAFSLENVKLEESKTKTEAEFVESEELATPGSLKSEPTSAQKASRRASSLLRNLDDLEDEIEYFGDEGRGSQFSDASPASPVTPSANAKTNTSIQYENPTLPHTYSFSFLVPEVQRALYLMVTRIVAFSAKNPLLGNMGEATCNSVLKAYECVAGTLSRELVRSGADTPLGKAAQVSTDAATLAFASKHCFELLKQSLHTLHWNQRMDESLASSEESARIMLIRLSLEAQDVVFEILRSKMVQLLESLVFMELTPKVLSLHPHEVIEDAIQFLEAKMGVLSSLPEAARTIAFFTCCNSIAHAVLQHLLSDKVKVINIFFLAALEQDCRTLAKYALTTDIPSLHLCFAELHETAQAALHRDLPKLATDPGQRHRLFPKLDPSKLAQILERVQAVENVPASSMLPKYDASSVRSICGNLRKRHPLREEKQPAVAQKVVLKGQGR